MELYQGFDTFSGKPLNQAVKLVGDPPKPSAESTLKVSVATSMEELRQSLEIEASMKVSYSVFSVEAKAKYLHELNFTSNSVAIVVYANNCSTYERRDVEIPGTILDTLGTPAGVDNFVRKYGDCWVNRIVQGGEFYTTFTFYSETREEKEVIETSLKANGVVGGVTVDASFAMKLSNVLNTAKSNYKIDRKLSGYSSLQPPKYTKPDEYTLALIEFANEIAAKKPDEPGAISYELSPYEKLFPSTVQFDKVKKNRSRFNGNPANVGWGEMVAQLQLVMNTARSFKNTYKFYNNYTDESLNTRLIQIQKDLTYLYDFIETVDGNPNLDYEFNTPVSYAYGTPQLNYSVVVPVGQNFLNGHGGTPYKDVDLESVAQLTHLYSVQISKGNIVDMLTAKYATKYPDYVPGKGDPGLQHGTPGGAALPPWTLSEDEFITSIYGKLDERLTHWVVSELYMKSNKGNTYQSNEYAEKDADQKWDAQPGDTLIGFAGSSGNNLDCLQPVVVRFAPASWNERILRI